MCVYYKNIILPILLLTLKEKYLKESHYFSDSMLKGVLLRSYKRRGTQVQCFRGTENCGHSLGCFSSMAQRCKQCQVIEAALDCGVGEDS